jgi:hypothetical protein
VASSLLSLTLQRARISLDNLVMQVDLRALINNQNHKFRPMVQWARNKLIRHPNGVAELAPAAVLELADFIGCTHLELAEHLARFVPDTVPAVDPGKTDASGARGAAQ